PANGRASGAGRSELRAGLGPDQSAALRDRLLAEVGGLTSADLASNWARDALPAKNRLTESDAKALEAAFEQRLSQFPSPETIAAPNQRRPKRGEDVATDSAKPAPAKGIDKSILAVPSPRRYRNREHLRFVAGQPCLICGRKPSDAHHLRHAQPRALGR